MGLKHLIEKLSRISRTAASWKNITRCMKRRRPSSTHRASHPRRSARARRHRPQAVDDPRVVCRLSGDVLGMYNVGLQTIPALHKLYGAEQLQQAIANNWHYSVAQWLG